MNSHGAAQWSQTESFTSMAILGEHDFTDLVDLDLGVDLQSLDFPIYDGATQETHQKLSQPFDLDLLQSQGGQQHHQQHQQQQPHHHHNRSQHAPPHSASEVATSASDLFDFGMPMSMSFNAGPDSSFSVPHQVPPPQTTQSIIPPTPNSVEMHGNAARYLQQMDAQTRAILEQQYHLRKGDAVNFTPLVSPAVTPLDTRMYLHDHTVPPGAYFSPLTSPALTGQQGPYHNNVSTSSAATSSPIDLDVDMLGESAVPVPPGNKSKSRKRPGSPHDATAPGNRHKQSPLFKAQQKSRKPLSAVIPTREVQQLLDQAHQAHTSPSSPTFPRSQLTQPSSGNNSISPEPMSEAVMGPPPKPHSAKQSPAILPQVRPTSNPNVPEMPGTVPATPASLMRLPHSTLRDSENQPSTSPSLGPASVMDDLKLPEASLDSRPPLGRSFSADGAEATPRMAARKTPKLGPLATPGSAALSAGASAVGTPNTSAVTSPTTPALSAVAGKKSDSRSRMSKKRGSVGSASIISPAIRPKISPSIKPLLPEGAALTEDSHALLLATRSNYQNLIEGTHVPGVSYPQELSTNLTSKRTSHKIAEQGRRNRINLALQEMFSLLPKQKGSPDIKAKDTDMDGDDDDEEKGGKMGKGGGSSKAATVESAIEYIKFIQARNRTLEQQQKDSNLEIEELRKKVSAMEKKLDAASMSDDPAPTTTTVKSTKRTAAREPKE